MAPDASRWMESSSPRRLQDGLIEQVAAPWPCPPAPVDRRVAHAPESRACSARRAGLSGTPITCSFATRHFRHWSAETTSRCCSTRNCRIYGASPPIEPSPAWRGPRATRPCWWSPRWIATRKRSGSPAIRVSYHSFLALLGEGWTIQPLSQGSNGTGVLSNVCQQGPLHVAEVDRLTGKGVPSTWFAVIAATRSPSACISVRASSPYRSWLASSALHDLNTLHPCTSPAGRPRRMPLRQSVQRGRRWTTAAAMPRRPLCMSSRMNRTIVASPRRRCLA